MAVLPIYPQVVLQGGNVFVIILVYFYGTTTGTRLEFSKVSNLGLGLVRQRLIARRLGIITQTCYTSIPSKAHCNYQY